MFVPGGWRWPRKKDTLMYSRSDVIQKLRPPVPVNSRGLFTFEDLNMNNNWFCCQCTFTVKHLNSIVQFYLLLSHSKCFADKRLTSHRQRVLTLAFIRGQIFAIDCNFLLRIAISFDFTFVLSVICSVFLPFY